MRAIATGCLALAVLLSGCSGSDVRHPGSGSSAGASQDAGPTPSSTPSGPPGTSAAAVASVPAPPQATDDRQGRVAFAKYVLQAWIYALNTNDPAPLVEVSGRRPCGGCADLSRELKKRDKQGWHVSLEGVRVSSTDLRRSGGSTQVVLSVVIPESASYNEDGTFRATNPAHPDSRFLVQMTHAGGRFRLDSFSLY